MKKPREFWIVEIKNKTKGYTNQTISRYATLSKPKKGKAIHVVEIKK